MDDDTTLVADVRVAPDGEWERWTDVSMDELAAMAQAGGIYEYSVSVRGPGGVEIPAAEITDR